MQTRLPACVRLGPMRAVTAEADEGLDVGVAGKNLKKWAGAHAVAVRRSGAWIGVRGTRQAGGSDAALLGQCHQFSLGIGRGIGQHESRGRLGLRSPRWKSATGSGPVDERTA